jgi:hypothetical protein
VTLQARRSIRHGFLWDKWHEYFDTKIIFEVAEGLGDSATGQILAMIPHGVYPFGAALALVGKGDDAFHNARPVVVSLIISSIYLAHAGAVTTTAHCCYILLLLTLLHSHPLLFRLTQ